MKISSGKLSIMQKTSFLKCNNIRNTFVARLLCGTNIRIEVTGKHIGDIQDSKADCN